jgi:hypothetical protein
MQEMRKLESHEEKEKREQRRGKVIGMVLLFLMVISTAGYAFLYNPNTGSGTPVNQTLSPNGEVQNIGNQWVLQREGQQFIFASSPDSVKNISVDMNKSLEDYYGNVLYIASKSPGIGSEIVSNLGRYASRPQEACYGPCNDSDLPEKDCSVNIIVYSESNENSVSQNESCVFIEGDIRAADAFLYRLFGVI